MNDTNDTKNDSDVSSNSSWTVLDDQQISNVDNTDDCNDNLVIVSESELFSEGEQISDAELNEVPEFIEAVTKSEVVNVCNNGNDELRQRGCLTFDEYLTEREIIHEYEYDEKKTGLENLIKKQLKREKNKRRKCKSEQIGALTIMGTVFAIAGVSLICLLCPNNTTLTSTEYEQLKSEFNATQAINNCNATAPVFPVSATKGSNKLTILDEKGVLEKTFKSNTTDLRQIEKLLQKTGLNSTQTFILSKNGETDAIKARKYVGPVTYEEYIKESASKTELNKQPLEKIQNTSKLNLQNASETEVKSNVNKIGSRLDKLVKSDNRIAKEYSASKIPKASFKKSSSKIPSNCNMRCNTVVAKSNTNSSGKLLNGINITPETKKSLIEDGHIPIKPEVIVDAAAHGKIACGFLQDVMLLKMTSEAIRRLKNEKKKKIPKSSCASLSRKISLTNITNTKSQETPKSKVTKSTIKYIDETHRLRLRKKKEAPTSTLQLLDELPFSQRTPTPEVNIDLQSYGKLLRRKIPLQATLTKKEEILVKPSLLNCHKNDVAGILDRFKQQQMLRLSQERHQNVIEALIKQRKVREENLKQISGKPSRLPVKINQGNKVKDACCGKYQVPIPSATVVKQKLLELNNKERSNSTCCFTFQNINQKSCRSNRTAKRKDINLECTCGCVSCSCCTNMDNCNTATQETKLRDLRSCHSKLNGRNSSEYSEVKRKYYERIGNYWQKREEFLEERINFMKGISESVEEVMSNYRNKRQNSDALNVVHETISNLLNEVAAAFPDDIKVHKLQSKVIVPKLVDSTTTPSCSIVEERGSSAATTAGKQLSSSSTNDSLFEFTAQPGDLVDSNNNSIKNEAFYNWLFGKKGRQIRKRDLTTWYYNKISKRRCSKDRKQDIWRVYKTKKSKKDI